MKYTLLDLVQTIASSMDSDEVNSISDSVESMQIAHVVRTVYNDIITRANLPEHFSFINLDPSLDPAQPNLMYVPDNVDEILWIKYNDNSATDTELNMTTIQFVELRDFVHMMYEMHTTDGNVGNYTLSISGNSIPIQYWTDRAPKYYTSFDDHTLVFDAVDTSIDMTLQASKTLAYAKLQIPWTMTDTFTPDLDDSQFALLLNESKALAWAELKQTQHAKAEQSAKRSWTVLQRNAHETEQQSFFDRLPNFGRK